MRGAVEVGWAILKRVDDQGTPPLAAIQLIALELFGEGAVSLGRAAELCDTPMAAFMER